MADDPVEGLYNPDEFVIRVLLMSQSTPEPGRQEPSGPSPTSTPRSSSPCRGTIPGRLKTPIKVGPPLAGEFKADWSEGGWGFTEKGK